MLDLHPGECMVSIRALSSESLYTHVIVCVNAIPIP